MDFLLSCMGRTGPEWINGLRYNIAGQVCKAVRQGLAAFL